MTIMLAIGLYAVIWWTTLFAVLPFGVRTQAEAGDVVPGTPSSAPAQFRLARVFAINTLVATIVFAVVVVAMRYDVLGLDELVRSGSTLKR